MSDDINYYELLEVTSTASQMEIRRAYKKIALKFHPDKNPTGAESFKNVTNAYNVLSDPILKNKYDMDNSSLFIREFFKFHKYDNDHEWNFFDKENKYSTRSNNEIPLNIKKFSSRNEKFYGEKIVELFLLFTMLYTTNKEMEMKLIYKVITFFKQNLFYTPYSFCVTNDEEVVAELFFAFTKLCDWEEKRIQELTSTFLKSFILDRMLLTESNYYSILGLKTTASQIQIRKAYYKLAMKYHPDRNPNDKESFKVIAQAYTILSEEGRKNTYDNCYLGRNTVNKTPSSLNDKENFYYGYKRNQGQFDKSKSNDYSYYNNDSMEQDSYKKLRNNLRRNIEKLCQYHSEKTIHSSLIKLTPTIDTQKYSDKTYSCSYRFFD
uniref:DnaJ homolog subfamily B member 9 n=1 Tax=Parastrongyloides trichosuri TaxID=131310 RepID=A0A0N4ZLM7_PARTI